MQDYFTKWLEVYAVADRKATTVAHCLAYLIWRHGVPAQIIYDQAAEFLSTRDCRSTWGGTVAHIIQTFPNR